MSNTPTVQIPRNLLFRYRFDLLMLEEATKSPIALDEKFKLTTLGRFDGQVQYANWRGAWSTHGLYFSTSVRNKQTSLWCRSNMLLESDSLQIWIDTRDTQNIHRASRYCHWFAAMPTGGTGKNSAICSMLKINRAKEDSPTINRAKALVESNLKKDDYDMNLFIPGNLLNGWDPSEHPQIGFCMASLDRDFGWQTLSVGPDLPIAEDPSLWCSLRLKSNKK